MYRLQPGGFVPWPSTLSRGPQLSDPPLLSRAFSLWMGSAEDGYLRHTDLADRRLL